MNCFRRWRPEPPNDDSKDALREANEALRRARVTRNEASKLASSLRELRQENHFAASIRALIEGGRQ